MKTPRWSGGVDAATFLSLLLLPLPAAAMLRCRELVVDGHKFNFGELAGPHTVVTHEYSPPSYYNSTYTLDICAPLKRKDKVDKGLECPNNSRVCAIKHRFDPETKKDQVIEVIPVAGSLADHGGKPFDWEAKRLSTSTDAADKDKEGVRVILKGGVYKARKQQAVVEFRCNANVTGLEGEWESEDQYVPGEEEKEEPKKDKARRDGGGDEKKGDDGEGEEGTPETQRKKDNAALIWNGWKSEGDTDTVYLTWDTKFACEKAVDEPPKTTPTPPGDDESRHWGFFTWIVILVFLATASYLIFGSWLNYNRYGARGWDLLPHGDAIRDIPYLLKDWTRRVLNTVQSSGSRGGYSAV
ncbi:autophagy-related protein 27 [Cercophora scortea]|uniref:Autophagy-related protein 27 n=1 Tax=Cercophora scortea TaxID=314031 RepID=A0AAE0IAJ2_9PEZI|nr:autophagy-related protein 27 [Cercophora scortea]